VIGKRRWTLMRVPSTEAPTCACVMAAAISLPPARKDGEVYHNGRLASGLHDYGGWFHFVGALAKTGDFPVVELAPGFTAWVCRSSAPSLEVFAGQPLVQVEFHTERVPWMLDETPAI
jgi:hypothetical protein